MKMTPFPIMMHNHVDQVNQAFFFLKDWSEQHEEIDGTRLLNDYMLFCFEAQTAFEERSDDDVGDFTDWWS